MPALCTACGVPVVNREAHTAFHEALLGALQRATPAGSINRDELRVPEWGARPAQEKEVRRERNE